MDRLLTRSPGRRFMFVWAISWAAIGVMVGVGISLFGRVAMIPVLGSSVLFAMVVGLTALMSTRVIFPRFDRLPYAASLPLQILTLLSAAILGSVLVISTRPLFFLAQVRLMIVVLLLNALLAVVAGIALHTYDSLRRQIARSMEQIQQKEALEKELNIARDVQQQLLPKDVPEHPALELAGMCLPAIGVGGDYYDFLVKSDEQVSLIIADVSGKGISAALLMAGLQASVRSLSMAGLMPADLNTQLNKIVYDSSPSSRYATLFQAHYDGSNHRFTYSNAGHHPPLILGRTQVERLDRGGFPIGMFPDTEYVQGEYRLEPGELITLFTDGVIESPNQAGEEFGEVRLLQLLSSLQDRPLPEIVDAVMQHVQVWSQGVGAFDDVTIVLGRAR